MGRIRRKIAELVTGEESRALEPIVTRAQRVNPEEHVLLPVHPAGNLRMIQCPHCHGAKHGPEYSYAQAYGVRRVDADPDCSVCEGQGEVTAEHAQYYHFGLRLQQERQINLETLAKRMNLPQNIVWGLERGMWPAWKIYLDQGRTVAELSILCSVSWTREKEEALKALTEERQQEHTRMRGKLMHLIGEYICTNHVSDGHDNRQLADQLITHAAEFRAVLEYFDRGK